MIIGVQDILANLDEEMVGKFVKLGIYYNYHWADASLKKYKAWQQVWETVCLIFIQGDIIKRPLSF